MAFNPNTGTSGTKVPTADELLAASLDPTVTGAPKMGASPVPGVEGIVLKGGPDPKAPGPVLTAAVDPKLADKLAQQTQAASFSLKQNQPQDYSTSTNPKLKEAYTKLQDTLSPEQKEIYQDMGRTPMWGGIMNPPAGWPQSEIDYHTKKFEDSLSPDQKTLFTKLKTEMKADQAGPAVAMPTAAPVSAPAAVKPPEVKLSAQQQDAYLKIAGMDAGPNGAGREAALAAFAHRNGMMGADGKPDMNKVNAALEEKGRTFIETTLKAAQSGQKPSVEDTKAVQQALVANGAKMPISQKADGSFDGKFGPETTSIAQVVLADIKTAQAARVAQAPVVAAAPAPAPAAAQPVPAAPPPAPVTTAAPVTASPVQPAPVQVAQAGPQVIRQYQPMVVNQGGIFVPRVPAQMQQVGMPPGGSYGTPGFAPPGVNGPGPFFAPGDPRNPVSQVERHIERGVLGSMRDRAADMGGVGGAILGGVTTATQGAFLSGRQQSIADERLAAMAAAGGNGPPNMRGSFGAAAADPEYLARMSAASHHATGAMRQRYMDQGMTDAASGILNQIAPAGWANRAIGKIFGN